MSDQAQLLTNLKDASNMWYALGEQLKIDSGTLKAIGLASGGNPSIALTLILARWLTVKDPPPTLEALVDALPNIGMTDIAENLLKNKDQFGQYND